MLLPKLLGLGSGETVPYNIHIGHHGKHGMHLGEGYPIPSGHKLSIPALKKYVHQHLMKGEGVFGSGVKYHKTGSKHSWIRSIWIRSIWFRSIWFES